MWSEPYTSTMKEHLDRKEFYMFVRDKYKFDKFNKVRPIRLRIYYPDLIYDF